MRQSDTYESTYTVSNPRSKAMETTAVGSPKIRFIFASFILVPKVIQKLQIQDKMDSVPPRPFGLPLLASGFDQFLSAHGIE